MGDLRNKARKEAETQAIRDAEDRRENGFTIFHFVFDPRVTRRNLSLGQAIRYLLQVTGTRISWWRCPIRGLAIQYRKLPKTSYAHDQGEQWMMLHFSGLDNEVEAKKVLALDMLLHGVELYRGLPNNVFDQQVELVRSLLKAPPSVSADEWLQTRAQLHKQTQPLLRTHEAELRQNLLGEKITAQTGPVEFTVRRRLEALGSRANV